MLKSTFAIACVAASLLVPGLAKAEETDVDFARQVLPILSDKCFVCHGPDTQDADLVRLDSFEAATRDLGGYQAIVPHNATDSELVKRIFSEDDPMPPAESQKQLTESEKQTLRRWIEQSGQYDKHWAYVPPKNKDAVAISDLDRSQVIDHFVRQKLQVSGFELAEAAPPEVLARRMALVLTGLPPDPRQVAKLTANFSEENLEAYVDELLASPRYGEHQARYWLDAARYGDTHGLHLDSRRGIYPYRDWVVKAYNDNLPLDDFVTWQLAGDLLPNSTLEQQVATGFVRLNPSTSEGGAIAEEFQAKYSFDRTETIGTVFLGMSLTCARCHTHKYDPITHEEYYQLFAFFNNTAEQPMDRNAYQYGPTVQAPPDQDGWKRWATQSESMAQLLRDADAFVQSAGRPNLLNQWQAADQPGKLNLILENGAFASWGNRVFAQLLVEAKERDSQEYTTTLVARELKKPRETFLLRRGEYNQPQGEPIQPDVFDVMNPFPQEAPRNRLGLAQWLTSDDHPLTSRVLVNQLWQRIFGVGLVRTPEDFGLQGEQPTHPELLDWLAIELRNSGWDQKAMLKAMVLSETFRQSSTIRSEIDDPENRLLARGPSYRLDAEVLRDIGLWASNLLDPTMGGEGVKPYQPPGMWKAMAHPASNTKEYVRDEGPKLYRRSLYVYWKRTSPHPMMTLFDAPSRESACVRRGITNTSLQSLALLNETQRLEMSRKFAERILANRKTNEDRIEFAFRLLASRSPAAEEGQAVSGLLDAMLKRYADDKPAAEALLGYGDAPRNKKFSAEELASWTVVASTLLASDIAILLY